ncbi:MULTISPECIES: ABC transporter permease subunit [unclassified Modestobacter]
MLTDLLRFAVLGAAAGGLYAVLALGLVVVYRSTRVVNFAHAAIAVSAAYAFNDFRQAGVPAAAALVIAVAVGLLLGLLVDLLVMRPLRAASSLSRAIGSIGVLILLQAVLGLRYGTNPQVVESLLPTDPVGAGDISVGLDRVIVLGLSLALTAVLMIAYRRTTFGLATSALAENRRSLAGLGWSPTVIGLVNWGVGGALAAIAGVLLAPITGLTPVLALVLILPALAAALLGKMASFPLTLAGGLLVGILQAETGRFIPVQGLQGAVPFFVIMVVLALQGQSLPGRGFQADVLPRPGSGRIPWLLVAAGSAVGVVLIQWVLSETWVLAVTTSLIVAVILLSLVLVIGYAGQLSLASFALAGVGALVAAHLVSRAGWPFLAAAAAGILAAGVVGFLVGLPAVRTRGISLGIVTLGLAVTVQGMVLDNGSISGGFAGLPVPPLSLFGLTLDPLLHPRAYGVLSLVVLVLTSLVVLNVRRSSVGRRLVAVRANERAAAALGINVPRTKLYAFVLSGFIAATGGILLAFRNPVVVLSNPGSVFDPFNSLNAVAQATIGGLGFAGGALAGTVVQSGGVGSQILDSFDAGSWVPVIAGVLLLVTVITAPDGIAANLQRQLGPLVARLRRRQPPGSERMLRDYEVVPVASATLEVHDLSVAFGGTVVLDGVSLTVRAGQVLGVIGPNGAGKTTLVDVITGYSSSRSGSVTLDGIDLTGKSPTALSRAGVTRSFQSLELFEDLSVADNLLTAAERRRWFDPLVAGIRPGRPELSDVALAAVQEFRLADRLDEAPQDLAYGDRRLLGIARALASRPRVLLLDEPAAGLGEQERTELKTLVRGLAERWNIAVLLIEHDVDLVMSVSDQVLALDFGRVIAYGPPGEVRQDPQVVRAYLGAPEDGDHTGVPDPAANGHDVSDTLGVIR